MTPTSIKKSKAISITKVEHVVLAKVIKSISWLLKLLWNLLRNIRVRSYSYIKNHCGYIANMCANFNKTFISEKVHNGNP